MTAAKKATAPAEPNEPAPGDVDQAAAEIEPDHFYGFLPVVRGQVVLPPTGPLPTLAACEAHSASMGVDEGFHLAVPVFRIAPADG